ncbi:DNA alkylation repair protein [Streptomyces sp. NPDC020681]|uniref:DNA alkylation repair protein n=1 Tax=Streptomyces sp. NPDC020681 TaxID=3365083 RepID=UPI0037A137CB
MPFADELLGRSVAEQLTTCIRTAAPQLDLPTLHKSTAQFDGASLRERSDLLRDALLADLPSTYADFAGIVRRALNDREFTGWMIWPVSTATAARALDGPQGDTFDDGMALLADLTPRLTAEYALRPFLDADLHRALAIVRTWTEHPDEHVRRLASEGTRPRLPWAVRVRPLLAEPTATLPVLNALYRDPAEYVRRSVANHLNDLSYAEPDIAVDTAEAWTADPDDNTGKVVRHGMRTLVKKGHPRALALLGFGPPAGLAVTGPVLRSDSVTVGGELHFEITVTNTADDTVRLAIDYAVHYRKANGRTAPKVFKLTTLTLAAGETAVLSRIRSFKPISTRVFHPGEHALDILVNGRNEGSATFTLTP